jgi:hypothetical protein
MNDAQEAALGKGAAMTDQAIQLTILDELSSPARLV